LLLFFNGPVSFFIIRKKEFVIDALREFASEKVLIIKGSNGGDNK
jgi:hypothetical protein